jgi:hypothetical protein
LDRGAIELVAAIPDFGGIPQPKSVSVHGWQSGALYFSLFGFGGNARVGDDRSDERHLFYRVTADGRLEETDHLPASMERAGNSGPSASPPFLRWSRRHLEVEIAVDARLSETTAVARLTFDPESGEPHLSMPRSHPSRRNFR